MRERLPNLGAKLSRYQTVVEERLRLTARTSGIASVWAVDAICFSGFFSGDSQKQGGINSNCG